MINDCIVTQPLTDIPIDSEGEFVESDVEMDESDMAMDESDVAMDESDEDNGLESRRFDGSFIAE